MQSLSVVYVRSGPEEAKLSWSGQLDLSVEHALQYDVNYTHSYYSLHGNIMYSTHTVMHV